MPEPPKPVLPAVARPYFEKLLLTPEFRRSKIDGLVLRILFESWTNEEPPLSQGDLTRGLGLQRPIGEDSLRPAIQSLRSKLSEYNNRLQHPIQFNISKGSY